MCLNSLPWLAVFAIADGAFALAVLIIALIMKGPIWTSSVTGQAWFFPTAVLGAVLYLVSIVLIVKFWNEEPFVVLGVFFRFVVTISALFVIMRPFQLALFPKEEDKCVDFCSSSVGPDLIYAVAVLLFLGTHWTTFHAIARAWELEKGFRPTCWQLIICFCCEKEPVAPAPAPLPFTHPSGLPYAYPSTQSNVNVNAHLAPFGPSNSNDVERWESASATRVN